MSVHLTRIYTKTGDKGTTALGDMSRVPKTHPRIAAVADVDEANAAIGVALAGEIPQHVRRILTIVQNDLFDLGADLCTPVQDNPRHTYLRVSPDQVELLERWCDELNAQLSKLESFILPGGSPGAAALHVARAVVRRAERSAWALYELEPGTTNETPLIYLNRLSDLLFICARTVTGPQGDVLWKPGGERNPPPPPPPS